MTILSSIPIDVRTRTPSRATTDGAEGAAIFCTISLMLLLVAVAFNASALMPTFF